MAGTYAQVVGSRRVPLPGARAIGPANPQMTIEATPKLRRRKELSDFAERPASPISRAQLAESYGAEKEDVDPAIRRRGRRRPAAVHVDPAGARGAFPRHRRHPEFRPCRAAPMTWTAAEASAMATLFTPGYPISDWYEYRYDIAAFIPLVTGKDSPFNDTSKEMARYYRSLGLYFPCTIGNARVLLIKSGLHLDYDGPKTLKQMVAGVAQAVAPKLFITTGTGGGIGADVILAMS